MATVILNYDNRNIQAQKTLEYIISMGFFKIQTIENQKETLIEAHKKPSDFFATLSADEGEKFQNYVTNSRLEWNRNI